MNVTYTEARKNLASYWDQVVDHREPLTIQRRGAEDVVMLPASELTSLQETAHLLKSPRNAQRLLAALSDSLKHEGEEVSIQSLKEEMSLDENKS